ncbi:MULTISPECIES: hypothetical protein [unclassified Corynebacterium]|uniref:hypothetical protein n=1 Tax=Corynebacterium rhinophilum TaxID=3050197 RepID=UPI0025511B00|nr:MULTISPECIES: hypothetical protein [unclassified Corynebacterium]MDK8451943.1 hypothetical protein [Corynebacterium sp. MSK084]MDK8513880.1 hypothetical protein [Corynebacterium sp. MSK123]MDK8547372.1 hypothetical protein [Corynebacterium sp. MSK222]MDK8646783.1 hypothetical protein [Corynebacterium sp. MSK082]MDK8697404.1 hypothetical protein [Corynebacterium sp. MSK192]
MSFLTPAKKSLFAVAMVAPLALAACSSDDEDDSTKTTSSSSATSSSETSAKESAKKSEDKDADKDKKEEKDKKKAAEDPKEKGEEGGNAGANANPIENGDDPFANAQDIKPIEGGHEASDGDKQAIEQLVRGQHEIDNVKDYFGYMPAHACKAVREGESGDFQQYLNYVDSLPNQSFAEYANSMRQQSQGNAKINEFANQLEAIPTSTKLESINDVVVNGDDASATVSVSNPEGTDTSTVRFRREDGNWTFCN